MGLDMYLLKKSYVAPEMLGLLDQAQEELDNGNTSIVLRKLISMGIVLGQVKYITEELHSWRKVNAIHAWFVENVQDGEDDCKEYYVTVKQLETLLGAVNDALELETEIMAGGERQEKAELELDRILPTRSGFFFGSTDYDNWYFADLKETQAVLEKVIADYKSSNRHYGIYYTSSW